MSRQLEYTGEACECGHPMYTRVVRIGARPEPGGDRRVGTRNACGGDGVPH
ncbi:MAG: hypothetical protein QOJ28_2238 [Mycobacterium sp.]|nr:hypothetical protein [Mycobacterium sp.]MDT5397159.1 hypothetical protein [Mycobacterium sp.]